MYQNYKHIMPSDEYYENDLLYLDSPPDIEPDYKEGSLEEE